MSAAFYLAGRYLLDRRHGAWGWLISAMAIGSIALGVAALIITLAVMTGFREDIQKKILGIQPHLIIFPHDGKMNPSDARLSEIMNANAHINASAPFVWGQVLMGAGSQTSGALVKGIDATNEFKIVSIEDKLKSGLWSDLSSVQGSPQPGKPGIFLGIELARNLGVRLDDTVWIVTPGTLQQMAFSVPKAHLYVVKGLIQSGLYDYDSSLAYIDLKEAQRLFNMGSAVSGVGVKLDSMDKADDISKNLQIEFAGAYWVQSWLSRNRNLFSALKLEKIMMFIILTLVTLVASFMIVSNLLLTITQKVKEIGILRAMGAPAAMIRKLFFYQGALMVLIGNFVGLLLGVGISLFLAKTNLIHLPADVYYIDRLPIRLEGFDILLVVAAASVIVLTATLYPAHRASKLDPLDAIRYG